jgi:hypothetical protein
MNRPNFLISVAVTPMHRLLLFVEQEAVPVLSNAIQAVQQVAVHVKQAEQQLGLAVQAQGLLLDARLVENRFNNTGLTFSF